MWTSAHQFRCGRYVGNTPRQKQHILPHGCSIIKPELIQPTAQRVQEFFVCVNFPDADNNLALRLPRNRYWSKVVARHDNGVNNYFIDHTKIQDI